MVTREDALDVMRSVSRGAAQDFMPGQWEAIDALIQRKRVFLVQRTGWGKSMVYFLTTLLLRRQDAGPTLILSPLQALMRNQRDAAMRLGLRAELIDSTNPGDWQSIYERVVADEVDLLLVSPERLKNRSFLEECLLQISGRIALFVVDEAHCISDWGHDFRPDYQRISRILRHLPPNIGVLATTATANDRVVHDVMDQLGPNTLLQRGPLARDSLRLQALWMPSRAARLAWLAECIPHMPGNGLIYTLTVADAKRVAAWLQQHGITAHAYHGRLDKRDGTADAMAGPTRQDLEKMLLSNEVKALVTTSALGMGYDKPDLGFVVHYQAPQSIVHYYQQVGRAGRSIDTAFGILLSGAEDGAINEFFITSAFPLQSHVVEILRALDEADSGLSISELKQAVNLPHDHIKKVLAFLAVVDAAPVVEEGARWVRTANAFVLDRRRVARITGQRRAEWAEVQRYVRSTSCSMAFLVRALDGPDPQPCGRCATCLGQPLFRPKRAEQAMLSRRAAEFIQCGTVLEPRKQWQHGAFPHYGWRGRIAPASRIEQGRALCLWGDGAWGEAVEQGKQAGAFSDALVDACAGLLREHWRPEPRPEWVTCVPSRRVPGLVPDFARRLAALLGLPFVPVVHKVRDTARQRDMRNSEHQARNLDGAFEIGAGVLAGPVLLVDDVADSLWSLTVVGALLREAGAGPVHPMVLALAGGG